MINLIVRTVKPNWMPAEIYISIYIIDTVFRVWKALTLTLDLSLWNDVSLPSRSYSLAGSLLCISKCNYFTLFMRKLLIWNLIASKNIQNVTKPGHSFSHEWRHKRLLSNLHLLPEAVAMNQIGSIFSKLPSKISDPAWIHFDTNIFENV